MVLKEEFESIIQMLEVKKIQDSQVVLDLIKRVHQFFQKINLEFESAGLDEKKELITMLSQLQKQMQHKIEDFCHQTGVSEDQIYQMGSDLNQLDAQQKEMVLSTKEQMESLNQNIKQYWMQQQGMKNREENPSLETKKKPKRTKPKWTKS